jgi:hypothetical protein
MTIPEIIEAVKAKKTVHWNNPDYIVTFNSGKKNQNSPDDPMNYYILCLTNEHRIGLSWSNGMMNGKPEEFFMGLSCSDKYGRKTQ